jgi:hypothetical protein
VILLFAGLARAGIVGDGAAAFEQGQLDDAIAAWEQARADGAQPSGTVEYDLGIAYYRKGDLPRAAARFRAAARLRPRDSNVHHNLALVRSGIEGVPDPVGDTGWTRVLTPGELGVLGVLISALGSLLVVVGPWFLSSARPAGAVVLATGIGCGALGASGARSQAEHPVAVVVDGEVVLRDAAAIDAGERLRLPVGTEVRVVRTWDGFLLVEDSRDRRGWVSRDAIELAWASSLVPRG